MESTTPLSVLRSDKMNARSPDLIALYLYIYTYTDRKYTAYNIKYTSTATCNTCIYPAYIPQRLHLLHLPDGVLPTYLQ